MHLKLVPPDAYPVPSALQTHEVRAPSFRPRGKLRSPTAWRSARHALSKVGLSSPDLLAGNDTIWWDFAVDSVEWNLETEEVVVLLADGTCERWDLVPRPHFRSSGIVVDSDMDDADTSSEPVDGPDSAAAATSAPSRWAPETVAARLRGFALELRSAYEDLGTASVSDPAAPDISTESDYRMLVLLAAEPSRQVPFEWSDAKTMYEYAMMDVDELLHVGVDATEERPRESGPSASERRPSQGGSGAAGFGRAEDRVGTTGQFRSRRRPESAPSTQQGGSRTYDYLSVIALLGRIRSHLCDLFAATVIPVLKERLPPTYTLWTVDSAIVWCRREAIRKARDAAELMLELLDDDGERFESSQCASSPSPSLMSVDARDGGVGFFDIIVDDGECGILGRPDGHEEWLAEQRRAERLQQNPLHLLRDDFELRRWCSEVIERARMLEFVDDDSSGLRSPKWTEPIPPWEVLAGVRCDSSEPDLGPKVRKSAFLRQAPPHLTSSASPSPSANTSPLPDLSHSDSDTSSELDELSMGDIEVGSSRLSPEFFYPDDPLGEGFLPRRLPKAVIESSSKGGPELEEHRERLHAALNQVAGLQKRLCDLHELVKEDMRLFEDSRAEHSGAGTRTRAAAPRHTELLPSPPPANCRRKQTTRPALLHQTGDRILSRSLRRAAGRMDPSVMQQATDVRRDGKAADSSPPTGRKRQRINLETYGKLIDAADTILSDEEGDAPSAGKKQKRKQSSKEHLSVGPKRKPPEYSGAWATELKEQRADDSTSASAKQRARIASADPDRLEHVVRLSDRRREALGALAGANAPSGHGLQELVLTTDEAPDAVALAGYDELSDELEDEIDELDEAIIEPPAELLETQQDGKSVDNLQHGGQAANADIDGVEALGVGEMGRFAEDVRDPPTSTACPSAPVPPAATSPTSAPVAPPVTDERGKTRADASEAAEQLVAGEAETPQEQSGNKLSDASAMCSAAEPAERPVPTVTEADEHADLDASPSVAQL